MPARGRARVAWHEGRLDVAIDDVERAITLFARANDRCGMANTKTNLGVLFLTNGEWDKATDALRESEEIRQSIDWTTGLSSNLLNLGWLLALRGERVEARQKLDESLRIASETGEEYDIAHAELALAYLDFLEDQVTDACRHLDSLLLYRDSISDGEVIQAQWLRALIECSQGSPERGVLLATEARQLARDSRLVDSEVDACRALGVAHARCENFEEAERYLAESADLADRRGDPYRRGLALLELGLLYERAAGRQPSGVERWRGEVQKQVEEAGRLFRRLGARIEIARTEELRSRVATA